MSEPKNDHEQLLDDYSKEPQHSGCIRLAWVIGVACLLLGFIAGHIR